MYPKIILIITTALISFASASDLPHNLQVGRTSYIDFPSLGKTWANKDTRMGVFLPNDYSKERKFPLFVWFGGGYGSDSPNSAINIVGREGFICVGLPYHHDGKQGELQTGGWHHTPWSYFKTMLDELEKSIPNINAKQRFCGGFSSGGAAIISLIDRTNGKFNDYFYAFMPGGAAGQIKGLEKIKGRPMYAFMGKKDSRISGYKRLEKEAQKAGVDITTLFYDAGHSMPNSHFEDMRKWINDKIILRDIDKLMNTMQSSLKTKKYGQAYQAANEIVNNLPPEMTEHQKALEFRDKLLPHGEAIANTLQGQKPNLKNMMAFSLAWKGCEFTQPINDKCTAYAQKQLDKILTQRTVSPSYLKKFILFWNGFDITQKAQVEYDAIAEKELNKILSRNSNVTSLVAYLNQFKKKWEGSTLVAVAQSEINKIAKVELEKIKAITRASSQKMKLKSFIKKYPQSDSFATAQSMLNKLK